MLDHKDPSIILNHRDPAIILNRAAMFAIKAHEGQFRNDGKTPFCVHPLRVASILASHNAFPREILCGYWHDILEDCPEKRDDLLVELESYIKSPEMREAILKILEAVTKPELGNRNTRNAAFIQQVIKGGNSAIMVKLCDRIDNVMDSQGLGTFAEQYVVEETGELLKEFEKVVLAPQCFHAYRTLVCVREIEIKKIKKRSEL